MITAEILLNHNQSVRLARTLTGEGMDGISLEEVDALPDTGTFNKALKAFANRLRTCKFEFNSNGKVTRVDYPGGRWEQFVYDDFGNKTQYANSSGSVHEFTYDDQNREVRCFSKNGENWNEILTDYSDPNQMVVTTTHSSTGVPRTRYFER